MPDFSKTSKARLATCHPDLVRVFDEVVKRRDCFIACGHRDEAAQQEAFDGGFSKVKWPNSKHNATPSNAVDACPWPEKWESIEAFHDLAAVVFEVADEMGVALEWGGDWVSFKDYPHWQLVPQTERNIDDEKAIDGIDAKPTRSDFGRVPDSPCVGGNSGAFA